jgi:hypothetical protein
MLGAVEVEVLGSSIGSWELRAMGSGTFESKLKPSEFESLSIFSTQPWPGVVTYLEVDFIMTNHIAKDDIYEV